MSTETLESPEVVADVVEVAPDGVVEETPDVPLGEKGERALHAEKERRKEESARRRELEETVKVLEGKLAAGTEPADVGSDDKIRAAITEELTASFNDRLKRSEVKAAAAVNFSDPTDALKFLDLSKVQITESGEVNTSDVQDLLDGLLADKPYLSAQRGKVVSPDAGARKGVGAAVQLTIAQVRSMAPEAIEAARRAGQLNTIQGIQ